MKKKIKYLSTLAASLFVITSCNSINTPLLLSDTLTIFNTQSTKYDIEGLELRNKRFENAGKTLVKIEYINKNNITYFESKGMDVWSVSPKYVMGEVNNELLNEIKSKFKYQMISPKEGMSVRLTFDKGYHTYDTMLQELKDIANKYPDIAKLHDIGDTWEKTQNKANRDIWAMQITNTKIKNTKPGVLLMGNHHAREIVTVELPMLLINHLVSNYGKDKEITELVDTRDIWIVPMVNPDGHFRVQQGKNQRVNANGVDLNRNYGYKWGTTGVSTYPGSETYCGKAPFSEPETQSIRDFEAKHPNIKASISWHSYSNLVLWPWSYGYDVAPDAAKLSEIGKAMASFSKYKPQQSAELYPASGDTDDWSYSQHKIFAFTIEVGSWNDGFDPPYSKIPKFWQENLPMAMYLIKVAGQL